MKKISKRNTKKARQIKVFKYKIELVTFKDISDFVKVAEKHSCRITLTDGTGYCVNGKSLIGAMATVEWDNLYCESEEEIYAEISKFCK